MDAHITAYIETAFLKIRLLKSSDKGEVWLAFEKSGRLVIHKRIAWTGLPYAILKEKGYPLIPRILHCIEEDGETLVVEEYVQGESLLDRIGRKAYLSEREAGNILLQLCDGLAPIHAQGIVHRDIKPSFDAARTVKEHSGEDTMHLGTKGYAPPEQFGYGQTDARSDIYSIGITLRESMPEGYGGYLAKIFARCTEIDPDRRYRNVQTLRRAVTLRRFWAERGRMALLSAAIVSVAAFFFLPRLDGTEPLPSIPAVGPGGNPPAVRLPNATEESPAAPAPETSADTQEAQSVAPLGAETLRETPDTQEAQSAVPLGAETLQETPSTVPSAAPYVHGSRTPPAVSPEEVKRIDSVDAFLAEFKDDPEKLAYWQTRNKVFFSDDSSEEERLEFMKHGELGLRTDAFIKELPKTMTKEERNRAIEDFVARQERLLDISD